jgi:hypothetical protein
MANRPCSVHYRISSDLPDQGWQYGMMTCNCSRCPRVTLWPWRARVGRSFRKRVQIRNWFPFNPDGEGTIVCRSGTERTCHSASAWVTWFAFTLQLLCLHRACARRATSSKRRRRSGNARRGRSRDKAVTMDTANKAKAVCVLLSGLLVTNS